VASDQDTQSEEGGKRVSWVELYLDLVFVLAVGELAKLIIDEPHLRTVWITLGLFIALWWTWVGFTVLYNRHGADTPSQRALYLLASLPVGAGAVALVPASHGHTAAFAITLAATRVVLAIGNARDDDPGSSVGDQLRLHTVRAYLLSVLLFIGSIWIPSPFRYVIWAAALINESAVLLADDQRRRRRRRSNHAHSLSQVGSADRGAVVEAHHFAERFGLFIIILLGEVVVEAGEAAADGGALTAAAWTGVLAAMALAATLWWTYFDAAADIDLRRLERSGGSPTMARAIFAGGHMIPAFALLVSAAGVGLLLGEDPTRFAYWLAGIGTAVYLTGARASMRAQGRRGHLIRVGATAITFAFGALHTVLSPSAYLWLLAAWVAFNAGLTARTTPAPDALARDASATDASAAAPDA
jgi:low temperature requirement protein LtrA